MTVPTEWENMESHKTPWFQTTNQYTNIVTAVTVAVAASPRLVWFDKGLVWLALHPPSYWTWQDIPLEEGSLWRGGTLLFVHVCCIWVVVTYI